MDDGPAPPVVPDAMDVDTPPKHQPFVPVDAEEAVDSEFAVKSGFRANQVGQIGENAQGEKNISWKVTPYRWCCPSD